ncbi:type I-F CRISPR-associated protein Csy2 [Neisseriaceae bacterium ESL0693]|nr:type I-F CRISPR-associated protein Csy2 [Neisseriaceae bacterium ESL0693]
MTTRTFLLLPRLNIHNANAMSSPYTIGFPAMTAWLGAMHALQRKLQTKWPVKLFQLAISCHQMDLQTYKGKNDFISSIIGTANPLDKDGNRPPFIEEARCHLSVSLLIEIRQESDMNLAENESRSAFIQDVTQLLNTMKFAGGDLMPLSQRVQLIDISEDDIETESVVYLKLLCSLMPGYVLIERRDLLIKALNNAPDDHQTSNHSSEKDILDILLDYISIHHHPVESQPSETSKTASVEWIAHRQTSGWLVPIAVGFQGISPLGHAQNQRDVDTPHRFAESIITLGEFIMPQPLRIKNPDDFLWRYDIDDENNLYLCRNQSIA